MNLTSRFEKRDYADALAITVVYFFTHWFLLVASGKWWDDWAYADKNWDYLYDVMLQSSLPLVAFLDASTWWLPDGAYRIVVFFLFYLGAGVIYLIFRRIELFKRDEILCITLLYITIPINDARILWICYPYSVGLFLSLVSVYLAIVGNRQSGYRKRVKRILSLFMFMISFSILESTMMLILPLVAYFCYEAYHQNWQWNDKNNIFKIGCVCRRYCDYMCAPIVWYFGDKILFPAYGTYGYHSYIPWGDLPSILLNSPVNIWRSFVNIIHNYVAIMIDCYPALHVMLAIILIGLIYGLKDWNNKECSGDSLKQKWSMFAVGVGLFYVLGFPYLVKRNSDIDTVFTSGRDSVLLGIGAAIILYYGCRLFFQDARKAKIVIYILVIIGGVHFNCMYLKWQENYYHQLGFQYKILHNEKIINNDTFLVIFKKNKIGFSPCQIAGNSYVVTHEKTRLYMPGTENIRMLKSICGSQSFIEESTMKDYKPKGEVIDGIVFIDFKDVKYGNLFNMKWKEIYSINEFNSCIEEVMHIKYVPITKFESNDILEKYAEHKLNDDMLVDMYLYR